MRLLLFTMKQPEEDTEPSTCGWRQLSQLAEPATIIGIDGAAARVWQALSVAGFDNKLSASRSAIATRRAMHGKPAGEMPMVVVRLPTT